MDEKKKMFEWLRENYVRVFIFSMIALGALAFLSATAGGVVVFVPMDARDVFDVLVPLILIGLFVERTVEVLVTSWRGLEREALEKRLKEKQSAGAEDGDVLVIKEKIRSHKVQTLRFAFMCAVGLSFFVAIVGVRTLEHLTDIELAAQLWQEQLDTRGWQVFGFRIADIIFTTGLLAGGADGIHKVLSLFLDFVDQSRARLTRD